MAGELPAIAQLDVPIGIKSLVELTPFEDIGLAVLRKGLPEIPVQSLIPPPGALEFPFILVHRTAPLQNWRGDPRFTDAGRLTVSVFVTDPDGIEKAQVISEAVRVIMRQAWLEHWYFPNLGSIIRIELINEATRSPDWATSAGPVQFADLPTNVVRFESEYSMSVRRPRQRV